MEQIREKVALTFIPRVGNILAKQLISYAGGPEEVFALSPGELSKIPRIGPNLARSIERDKIFKKADETIEHCIKNNIELLFYLDLGYPNKLKDIEDAPVLLYKKGKGDVNYKKTIGIVGTRNATPYGIKVTSKIIEEIKDQNVQVISGLALGIDIQSHKSCIENNVSTVGVMATGIDTIYPERHKSIAEEMYEKGAVLTEYPIGTKPDPKRFPARNRIIAGMSDAIIVVEAAHKGGALITAEVANSYNKEVFAVPGNLGNPYSTGCNNLIKAHKAYIYTNTKDLEYYLGWDDNATQSKDSSLDFSILNDCEKRIADVLKDSPNIILDELSRKTQLQVNELAINLLTMEMNGYVKANPGNKYELLS